MGPTPEVFARINGRGQLPNVVHEESDSDSAGAMLKTRLKVYLPAILAPRSVAVDEQTCMPMHAALKLPEEETAEIVGSVCRDKRRRLLHDRERGSEGKFDFGLRGHCLRLALSSRGIGWATPTDDRADSSAFISAPQGAKYSA